MESNNTADIGALWLEYEKTRSIDIKNELITHYLYIVEKTVKRMMPVYGQHFEYDDMISCGVIGLIDAVDKFDCAKNVKFETYSTLRIKGEIIDNIRRQDWAPVTLRSKLKSISLAYDELAAEGVTAVNDEDVAKRLNMDVDKVRKAQIADSMFNVVSLEEILYKAAFEEGAYDGTGSTDASPSAGLESSEIKSVLRSAVETLSDNEKLVVQLYYYEEILIKDIAAIIGVSESRVSQIHSKALGKLKKSLQSYYYPDE